jgi:periplasmic divalent cation tolerance protein
MSDEVIQVVTTVANADDARRIGRALVEQRLAACVQIVGPLESIYWWQGQVEMATEWQCLIKTVRSKYAAVEEAIRKLHPYEVPEILAMLVAAGNSAYLQWVVDESQ